LLARRLCRPRAGLVFAPLVSLTETLADDRRLVAPGGPCARALAWIDRASLRAADLVLADTRAHAEYLAALGAPRGRLAVWYLGAEPEFLPALPARPAPRRVLFYGRHLPLHGVETIVAAAARLGERAEVVLIGDGPERARAEALGRGGARIAWRDAVPPASLPAELASAAVVLGVFGASQKAAMVVPNKVWQAAGAGRRWRAGRPRAPGRRRLSTCVDRREPEQPDALTGPVSGRARPPSGYSVELVLAPPVDVVPEGRLRCLVEEERAEDEVVHLGPHEAEVGIARRAHDRLAPDVEARVHEDGAARERVEATQQRVVDRVRLGVHRLDARRVIDVRDRWDGRARHVELLDPEQALL